jgi:hypothetical protein
MLWFGPEEPSAWTRRLGWHRGSNVASAVGSTEYRDGVVSIEYIPEDALDASITSSRTVEIESLFDTAKGFPPQHLRLPLTRGNRHDMNRLSVCSPEGKLADNR